MTQPAIALPRPRRCHPLCHRRCTTAPLARHLRIVRARGLTDLRPCQPPRSVPLFRLTPSLYLVPLSLSDPPLRSDPLLCSATPPCSATSPRSSPPPSSSPPTCITPLPLHPTTSIWPAASVLSTRCRDHLHNLARAHRHDLLVPLAPAPRLQQHRRHDTSPSLRGRRRRRFVRSRCWTKTKIREKDQPFPHPTPPPSSV